MVNIQKYVRAQSLEEAYELNQNKRSMIVGGMLWTKMGSRTVSTAIDLCDLNLNKIEESDEEFSIGAMVTLRQIEMHEGLNAYTNGAAKAAVKDIIGVQFRNMATVGGSIWGRFGFSDVLTLFMAMDSYVELYKGGIVPLAQFAAMKADRDVLVRLIVKKTALSIAYQAVRNQKTDFPVLNCACARLDGDYRVVIGARPGRAVLVRDEQNTLSGEMTDEKAALFAQYAAQNVTTKDNLRAGAAYRTHLIRVLTERGMKKIGG